MKKCVMAAALALVVLTSCDAQSAAKYRLHENPMTEVSWREYCEEYNVDPQSYTSEEYNDFLDCWSGSDEEERILEDISWEFFSAYYVVDKDHPTPEELQDYEESWKGSDMELKSFDKELENYK